MRKTLVSLAGALMVLVSCGLLCLAFVDGVAWIWFGSGPPGRVLPLVLVAMALAIGLGRGGIRLAADERYPSRHLPG